LTVFFFWPVFFASDWLPRGGGDLVSFLWPQYSFAGEAIRSGMIPLWNPHLYSGAPFLADNQSGVLYPINLLAFLVFPNLSYQVMEGLVIFHLWLAGAAMYVALRVWPLTPTPRAASPTGRGEIARPAALFGAIAFMFNDVLITHIGNLNLIAVAAWLPLILALYARGLSERRASWIVASGVVLAIALLAGHAQMTAITLIGLMAVAVWQIIDAPGGRGRVIGLALVTPLIALGLSAAQLLPSLEMTRYSLRAGLSYEEATAYSLPPAALASTFSPLLFGRGAAEFWGPWERVETAFVGVVPLLLAGLAFRRKWRDSAWFLLALGVLGLLIALGQYTPIYSLVHSLPVLGGLRVPARFILLTNFSLAALAAIGLQRFMTESFSLKRVLGWGAAVMIGGALALIVAYQSTGAIDRGNNLTSAFSFWLFAGAALLILVAAIKSAIRIQHSAILLIGVLSLELVLLGSGVEIDRNDPTLGYQHRAVIDFLKSDGNGTFRIENASKAWQPDAALMHRLNDIGGIFNPLGLASYETYRGGMGDRGSPLYNFLGAKYVLANKDQPPGDASFVPVFNGDPQIDVYLNTQALPRAQLIDRALIVQSGEEAWQTIHAAEFDPSKEVVIENGA
ncbi:MAG: YfhO family protein, partial [Chloroflexi bacterium]|nr:YfhO family protein [Chloroflexota bacterium]